MKKFLTLIIAGLLIFTSCSEPGGGNGGGGGGIIEFVPPLEEFGGLSIIGTITGTITLTDVPSPAPDVYITARCESPNHSSFTPYIKLNISDTQDISWSIPIFNDFSPSDWSFSLRIDFANSNSFEINIPTTPSHLHINSATENVGSLGEVSINSITLSGTVNVTANGQAVDIVRIEVYSDTSFLSYITINSPDHNAPWSIRIPALDTKVHFWVSGYKTNENGYESFFKELFRKEITFSPEVTVNKKDVPGINLNVGKFVTLSGNINATYNGQNVPTLRIDAYGNNEWLYSTWLDSPGTNAPWSITIPALDTHTQIHFIVSGYPENGDQLFSKKITPSPAVTVNANSANVSGINLNVGIPENVTFNTLTANGSESQTTTQLTLSFDQAIPDLTANDITLSGVSGVQKGTLSVSGSTYTLPISGFTSSGTLTVAVSKKDYTISSSTKTVPIYYAVTVAFNTLTANGGASQTTTQLTLSFSQTISGLTANDITLSGVSGVQKGTLSVSGSTYTLIIVGFTSGGTLSVSVSKAGYSISSPPNTVPIYYAVNVAFSSLTADGSEAQTTTQLTLTFNKAIDGLTADDITLSGVSDVQKGTLSGSGPTYTLPISGFTSGGTLTVAVSKAGYNISSSSKTVKIYKYTPPTVGIIINLGIKEWELTEQTAQVAPGVNKTFTVTGTYNSYRWYLDGVPVGTSPSYIFNGPVGVYQLVVVVTDGNGESRSGRCWVTVK